MDITLDIEYIRSKGLYVEEYLFLRNLVLTGLDKIIQIEDVIRPINLQRLESLRFIKLSSDNKILLRQSTVDMFNVDENLADKFIGLFPIKTPNGRALSPLRAGGKKYDDIVKKFNKIFKNKSHAERAILVLEAEKAWRIKTDGLEFMHNIETWLNQADYENYEHLLEEDPDVRQKGESYNDWVG